MFSSLSTLFKIGGEGVFLWINIVGIEDNSLPLLPSQSIQKEANATNCYFCHKIMRLIGLIRLINFFCAVGFGSRFGADILLEQECALETLKKSL